MAEKLPRLGRRQRSGVANIRRSRSGCSTHHVDLGLIPPEDEHKQHRALRRLARRMGFRGNKWIGHFTQKILNSED